MSEVENEIGLSITNYKDFFKLLPTPIYIWKKTQNDFILADFNNAAEKITEGKIKEIEGTKASVFFKDREEVLKDLHNCVDQKTHISRKMKYTLVTTGQEKKFNVNYFYISPDLVLVHTEDITEKKNIEKKMRYQANLVENVSDAIISTDMDFKIYSWNKSAELIYGWKAEEVIGKNINNIITVQYAYDKNENILKQFLEKGHWRGVVIQSRKDNTKINILSSVSLIKNTKGKPIGAVAINRDITEQKKTEEKIKESEIRFRSMIKHTTDAVFCYEYDPPISIDLPIEEQVKLLYDGVLVECNLVCTQSYGYNRIEDVIGHKLTELFGTTTHSLDKLFKDLIEGEYHIINGVGIEKLPNGEERFFLNNGHGIIKNSKLTHIWGAFRDVTDKIKAEEKLKESEEKHRALIENLSEMILILDKDGVNIWGSPAVRQYGMEPENAYGINTLDYTHPDDRDRVKEAIDYVVQHPGENINVNGLKIVSDSGMMVYLDDTFTYLPDTPGINGIVVVCRNVTDKIKAELKLKDKNIELSFLNDIISLGNESHSLQEFLEKAYDQVLDTTRFDRGGIYLFDPQTQHNVLIHHKNVHPDFINAVKAVDISEGLFSRVFDKEKPFYIEDFSKFMEDSKELGVYSALIVPLRSKDEYVGSLNIASTEHQVLSQKELELLVAIGKQMGIIIQKFESETLLKKSEEKYRKAYNRSNLYKDIFTHDINNVLQNILSSIELSKLYSHDITKKREFQEVSNLISEQVSRGALLATNVQKLADLEGIITPLTSIEMYKILEEAIKSIKNSFTERNINIQVDSLQNEYYVKANNLLINIFENILHNAIKHNKNQIVEIMIRISTEIKEGKSYVKLEFLDNGIGIHDSLKKKTFHREYEEDKVDKMPSGIGLGLLLVNIILNSYNGEIKVKDRIFGDYTKGSNFIMLIPEAI